MKHSQTILEIFQEGQRKDEDTVQKYADELSKKIKEREKILADVGPELEKERAILTRLKAEYAGIEAELGTAARAEIERSELTKAKVDSGEITIAEFLKAGIFEKEIQAKVKAEVTAKLDGAREIIRAKRARIFDLEFQVAEAKYNIENCTLAIPRRRLELSKQSTEAFERSLAPVYEVFAVATKNYNEAKHSRDLCEDKGIYGMKWESLTYEQLKDLRFDPRIQNTKSFPDAIETLEKIIEGAKPDCYYTLILDVNPPGHFTMREDSPIFSKPVVSTATVTQKGGEAREK